MLAQARPDLESPVERRRLHPDRGARVQNLKLQNGRRLAFNLQHELVHGEAQLQLDDVFGRDALIGRGLQGRHGAIRHRPILLPTDVAAAAAGRRSCQAADGAGEGGI